MIWVFIITDNEEHNLIAFVGNIINNYHVIDLLRQGISSRVYEVYIRSKNNKKRKNQSKPTFNRIKNCRSI